DEKGQIVPQLRRLPEPELLWRVWQDAAAIPLTAPPATDSPVAVECPTRKALVIRRAFLKGMNYFDEKYGEWGADLELAYQIRHAGKKALILPDIRAIDRSGAEQPPAWSSSQRAVLAADRLNGVSHFLAKRAGFLSGLFITIRAVLLTFLRALTFQD